MSDYLLIAHTVGVYYNEGPPVPIPNTVVKLISAEDTWWETARENRSMPTQKLPVRNHGEYNIPP